jgi:hypothetical protein
MYIIFVYYIISSNQKNPSLKKKPLWPKFNKKIKNQEAAAFILTDRVAPL